MTGEPFGEMPKDRSAGRRAGNLASVTTTRHSSLEDQHGILIFQVGCLSLFSQETSLLAQQRGADRIRARESEILKNRKRLGVGTWEGYALMSSEFLSVLFVRKLRLK